MKAADERTGPVKAKAFLIDPASLTVLWMNESAAEESTREGAEPPVPVLEAVPVAETLGVPEALRSVAETGVAAHLRADLVSTVRGKVAIVASVYRLPGGELLLLMENAWFGGRGDADEEAQRRGRPRGRR